MNLGGLLVSLLLCCDVKVKQEPLSMDMRTVPVCHSSKKAIKKSRESSVVIEFMTDDETVGKASGNYFKYRGHRFILTAAHVALAPDNIKIYVRERFGVGKQEAKVAFVDNETDLAIIVVKDDLDTVTPINWRRKDYWDIDIGDKLYYTGHPMDMDYMSFNGSVSRVLSDTLIMQGWAYMGSSGSAVFDSDGRVVGVVSAIRGDWSNVIPQMLPSIVLLAPLTNLDNKELYEILKYERRGN